MYRTSNTLSENIRSKAVALLNRHLAAAIDLHAQVKQAHWNVRGPAFIAIHELFDKVADLVEGYSDTIAERAAALGGTAEGTVQVAVERSFLEPYTLGVADEKEHLTAVTAALATLANLRARQSTRPRDLAIRTPRTCLPRCRAASISSFGSSSRIYTGDGSSVFWSARAYLLYVRMTRSAGHRVECDANR